MPIVKKVTPFFTDSRGRMTHILPNEKPITSALLITSVKGSVRANHYHKKDTHYVYLIKGKLEYTYKKFGTKNSQNNTIIVEEGSVITTPPMTIHAMKFLEDSEFIALTTEPRSRKKYEADTIRLNFVT